MDHMYTSAATNIVASNSCEETAMQTLVYFILACVTGLLPPDVCCQVTHTRKHLQDVAL